jgi:hypothetical protein
MKEINYNKKIKIDNLILEELFTNYAGLSRNEINEIKAIENNNIELIKLRKKYSVITDPFERLEYFKQNGDNILKLTSEEESMSKQFKKHKKFLNKLKKLNKKCVLVVGQLK